MRTLWVVGDSTLSAFDDEYYYPRYGYGTMLKEYLDNEFEVHNLALSGRSSKSFCLESEYKSLIDGMKQGDYLIIGFGHNDEKTEAGRFTCGTGDYKTEGSFANSLYENYVKPAKEAGCVSVVCTPVVRRTTSSEWQNSQLHITEDTPGFNGGDYRQSIINLGKDVNIPVVDMTGITKELYDRLTPDESKFLHAWSSNKDVSVDNTHTNIWGARVNAYNVLKTIKETASTGAFDELKFIAAHIVNLEENPVLFKDKYLVSNPCYKPVVFNADLPDSIKWKEVNGWKPTVFGDLTENLKEECFKLEESEDGGIHISVSGNIGKIAAASDGIAMYYKKIPAGVDFTFTAKARINDYFLNDQVSFGLMVRDDMYIDTVTADVLGDYVAAAPLLLTRKEKAVNCFARKSGKLTYGGICTKEYKPGDVVDLKIQSNPDGYACTFADEQTITGGFDFKLVTVDAENVYVGFFVSRNADISFSDINLELSD